MAARIKSVFSKRKGKGNHGPANDPPQLNPHDDLVQSNTEESVPHRSAVSEENKAKLKNEYGIKVLYKPERPRVDIIFVHGLTGSQLSTWTAPGAAAPWPQILLADDIPDARISAFGYDADVVNLLGPIGQNRIRHHAMNLFRTIAD
ncbi:hypothetical protein MMC27_006124, partial [Xylographa pallens]|nr:hypothetical protein [Xylographa pallens]